MYHLSKVTKEEYPAMLQLWEASVRATHHFLTNDNILELKNIIITQNVFDLVDVFVARNEQNKIIGIMGLHEDQLAMLFVAPDFIGKGVGKMLIQYALAEHNIKKVEVNEQNPAAISFYEKFGFKEVSRTEMDAYGNPYPIIKMEIKD
ncbi:MAG TPA: GNAT family N-acetyltransferase [Ferruginibacter sp.]|nr:GNAT family N-acetyltransferase [Ferruginibacter sp.]